MLLQIEYREQSLLVRVSDDANLDGQFVAVCEDTNEHLRINGWMAEIERVG